MHRRLSLVLSCLAFALISCQQHLILDVGNNPASMRESESTNLKAIGKNAKGEKVPTQEIMWTIDPASLASINGTTLIAQHEGIITITAKAGNAVAQHQIEILSPIVGTWVRRSQPYKGMVVEIAKAGEELVGTIRTAPPSDEDAILAAMKELHSSKAAAKNLVTCEEQLWSSGLRKVKEIKRIDATTWNAKNLKISPLVRGKRCEEGRDSGEYEDFEIKIVDLNHLEMNSLTSSRKWSSSSQKWERLGQLVDNDASTSNGVTN